MCGGGWGGVGGEGVGVCVCVGEGEGEVVRTVNDMSLSTCHLTEHLGV